MGDLPTLLGNLDPDERVRGRQFERVCKWFLKTDPVYAGRFRRVWLWDEYRDRWGVDAGIDLVAETHEGDRWAIQAKVYDPRYAIKKSDVDTFLSESSRPEFSYRLLITTTDVIGKTAKGTIDAQEKPCHILFRSELERAAVDWPASPEGRGAPAKPAAPRPHQKRAVRDVVRGFRNAERGQLIMACGTGKTLTALWISEALGTARTLVLVPSLLLLGQTVRVWTENAARRFRFLPVCSDEDVAKGEDEPASTASELAFPVTTSPAEIAAFLRGRGPRVMFATYQSSPKIAEAFGSGRVPAFDLAIADEAHRCAGMVASEFGTVLRADAIRARRRLFMTATPRFFTGRLRAEAAEQDLEIASMDDAERFGEVVHELGFADAIDRGLLADYRVAIVVVDDVSALELVQGTKGAFVELDGHTTDARTLALQLSLAKAIGDYDLQRVVTFHGRVDRAKKFAGSFPAVLQRMPAASRPTGEVWAEHVSGAMPTGTRETRLAHLRNIGDGERGLLSNARCLAEGVDVPTLDGIAFIDPKGSQIDIIQAVGRAIRKAEGKKVGTIVVPVFVDRIEDAAIALEGSAYKPVWDVVNALRAHDGRLAEDLDAFRYAQGRQSGPLRHPSGLVIDSAKRLPAGFVDAFTVRLVEETTASWRFWFGLLEKFVDREGRAEVPAQQLEDGHKLGQWVSVQRRLERGGVLLEERRRLLDQVPGWSWDPLEERWDSGLKHLRSYVSREGHARFPIDHVEGGFPLGQWVAFQRTRKRQGKLSRRRIETLEGIRGWSWNLLETTWEENFERVRSFADRVGHSRVSQGYEDDDVPLGRWVSEQRQAYREGTLDPGRARRLAELPGWAWRAWALGWERGFDRLLEFARQHGHVRVPRDYSVEGFPLGAWVSRQRKARKLSRLSDEQVRFLDSLPGWTWDTKVSQWDESFDRLAAYMRKEGRIPTLLHREPDGSALGQWVGVQRKNFRRGVFDPDRASRLESLPGWTWDPFDDQWEEGHRNLLAFAERQGSAQVPVAHVEDGFPLGQWAAHQRTAHRRGKLDRVRTKRLEHVVGWRW